ncbi:Hypothetical predicted protein [Paramuricea clavata]|uniref:Uncharacterized protein n=1 Tax=Paramuricea clavata TaxID=317549 RepID=A0A6S7K141_PARCT|nr:Hypothetical predicted protein [Paramuricea clavata]
MMIPRVNLQIDNVDGSNQNNVIGTSRKLRCEIRNENSDNDTEENIPEYRLISLAAYPIMLSQIFNTCVRKDLEKLSWAIIESFSDRNDMWHTWKTLFNSVLDNHAPVRTKRVRNLDVPDLKKMMFPVDYLKKRAAKTQSDSAWRAYCTMRNRVNYEIIASKNSYFSHNLEINKGNLKENVEIVE